MARGESAPVALVAIRMDCSRHGACRTLEELHDSSGAVAHGRGRDLSVVASVHRHDGSDAVCDLERNLFDRARRWPLGSLAQGARHGIGVSGSRAALLAAAGKGMLMLALLLLLAAPSSEPCWTSETCRPIPKAEREMSRKEARDILIDGLKRRGLAVPDASDDITAYLAARGLPPDFAPVLKNGQEWADCAFDNLPMLLPNDFDPLDAIAAAAVDYCVQAEWFRGAYRDFLVAHKRSLDQLDTLVERQRRTMIRLDSAEIVRLRSVAAKQKRGMPIIEPKM